MYVFINIFFLVKLDFCGNIVMNWCYFKCVWENYEIVSGLKERNGELRVVILLICLGVEVLLVYDGLKFESEED